ncbi:sensor histidine kinase [Blastococcus sp. Marseille-P5729]|uniref:sensor histidine kinase n=1 Tax=Blastococcus sp. Marseille-P5729 TaxID=2086582 RepID=UPI000D0F6602|nr:sensor histidine kinase [Blastococcus sp. Marseille-P5729]
MPTRRRPDARAARIDLLLAAALAGVGALVALLSIKANLLEPQPVWVPLLASCALAVPIAVRRRWPVPAMLTQAVIYIAAMELGVLEFYASQVCLFVGVYAVGAWETNRRLAFGSRLLIVLSMAAWFVIGVLRHLDDPQVAADRSGYVAFVAIQLMINAAFFIGAWLFGDRAWRDALARADLDRAHGEITAQQVQLAEQAVGLERVRIARELHDVVAHHVSAMGIQAGAARRVLESDPDRAAAMLRTVEQSAREAIGELRTMVAALRNDSASEEGPPPTLDDLSSLLDAARSTGQQVTFTTVGERRALSPAVGLTIYRVTQESLTNARKHARPNAAVDVRLRYTAADVEVEIADDGLPAATASGPAQPVIQPSTPTPGGGLGLVGMRERVIALGGELEAGPRSRGGWLVRAAIPVPQPSSKPTDPADPANPANPANPAEPGPRGPGDDARATREVHP